MQQQLNESYSPADYALLAFHEKELQISPLASDGFHLRLERIINTYRFVNEYEKFVKISTIEDGIESYIVRAQKYRKDLNTFTGWKERLMAVISAFDTGAREENYRLCRVSNTAQKTLDAIDLIVKSMGSYHMTDAIEHRIVLIGELIEDIQRYLDEERETRNSLRLLQSDDDYI